MLILLRDLKSQDEITCSNAYLVLHSFQFMWYYLTQNLTKKFLKIYSLKYFYMICAIINHFNKNKIN